jgi:hypothetical protein
MKIGLAEAAAVQELGPVPMLAAVAQWYAREAVLLEGLRGAKERQRRADYTVYARILDALVKRFEEGGF